MKSIIAILFVIVASPSSAQLDSRLFNQVPPWAQPVVGAVATSPTAVLYAFEAAEDAVLSGELVFELSYPGAPSTSDDEWTTSAVTVIREIKTLFDRQLKRPARMVIDLEPYSIGALQLIDSLGKRYPTERKPLIDFVVARCRETCADVSVQYAALAAIDDDYPD